MLYDVIGVKVVKNYILYLRFEDGAEVEVDISKIVPFKGIFSKLQDKEYFSTVYVNKDLGTIVWDNGADLSPSCLYSAIEAVAVLSIRAAITKSAPTSARRTVSTTVRIKAEPCFALAVFIFLWLKSNLQDKRYA